MKPPVILIAGGANTRFFPLNTIPHKGALTLCGQPLFLRTLANLVEHDYHDIIFVQTPRDAELRYSQTLIEKSGLPVTVTYVTQAEPKGMGDALLQAEAANPNTFTQNESFAVISAYHIQAGLILDKLMFLNHKGALCTAETDRPSEYGIVKLNEQSEVIDIVEKPAAGTEPSHQKILSMYILPQKFVSILKNLETTEYNFETALAQIVRETPLPALALKESLPSLKFPWDVFAFQQQLLWQLESSIHHTAKVAQTAVIDESAGPVFIDEGAEISHAARIVGPAYIGKHVFVGDFCLVRHASLEEGVRVGTFSEVARSVMLNNSSMHSGFVGDSVIGENVRIGAGITTANKRLDREAIKVMVKDAVVQTKLRALGGIIGADAHLGVYVSVMPGVCIGPNAIIYPNSVVARNVPASTTYKPTLSNESTPHAKVE